MMKLFCRHATALRLPRYRLVLALAPRQPLKLENHKHLEMLPILNRTPICLSAAQNLRHCFSICHSGDVTFFQFSSPWTSGEGKKCGASWATLVCMQPHKFVSSGERRRHRVAIDKPGEGGAAEGRVTSEISGVINVTTFKKRLWIRRER